MPLWLRLVVAILVVIGVILGVTLWIGSVRWSRATDELVGKLSRDTGKQTARTVSFRDFDNLPAPVARYFRMALREGQPLVRTARVVHRGEFLTDPEKGAWSPFASTQHFSANPPGFVWNAEIRMAPLMKVRVRDAYLSGKGSMQASIVALVPVMDESGKPELNAGALQRFLAEAVWFPTTLLPGEGIVWSAVDAGRAVATLTGSGTTVSLEFTFNDAGEITRVSTPGRYREVDGKYELTPWSVRLSSYEERDGMRIPLEGEVAWLLPGGGMPYWKGRIAEVRYGFAR